MIFHDRVARALALAAQSSPRRMVGCGKSFFQSFVKRLIEPVAFRDFVGTAPHRSGVELFGWFVLAGMLIGSLSSGPQLFSQQSI